MSTIDDLILAEERCQEVIARMTETMAYVREAINTQAWIMNADTSDTYDAMSQRDRAINAAIDRCINDTPAIKRLADILNDTYYRQ